MKLLFIGFNQTGVGTYWRMFHFARHLVQSGHNVTIIVTSPQRRRGIVTYVRDGINIVETPSLLVGSLRSGWDIWEIIHRIAWMKKFHFDLIHAFETRPTVLFPALFQKYIHKTPLFFDWCDWFGRGGSVEERRNRLQRIILRQVDTFFEEKFRHHAIGTTVICETLRQKAISLGRPDSEICLIRDGSSLEAFYPMDKQQARKALHLPQDVPIVGYLGAIYYRDAEFMSSAFDSVQSIMMDTKLLLIGYINQPIRMMVKNATDVIESGKIPFEQLNQWISACDVCWLPYLNTGTNRGRWPMKLNDYMAAGRPVVATAVGDVDTVMQKYPIGILTEPTAASFAQENVNLLNEPEKQRRLGENARKVAEEHFTWKQFSENLLAFYQSRLETS